MPKQPNGSKLIQLGLAPDLVERFLDFCEGYEGAPVHRLMTKAIEAYMADRYSVEPEVKRRVDEARLRREHGGA